jgi:hypothetical protein
MCIHRHEGPWTARTGNGYYGGLQMDLSFQRTYGTDFLARWGTADRWPPPRRSSSRTAPTAPDAGSPRGRTRPAPAGLL